MARLFDDAQEEYLEIDQAVIVSGVPLAIGCLFNTNDAATQTLVHLLDKDTEEDYHRLYIHGNTDVTFAVAGPWSYSAITTGGYSYNNWHHACGITVSGTERRVFVNGGSKDVGLQTTGVPDNLDRLSIGKYAPIPNPLNYMSGQIAEVAIWDLSQWPGATDSDKADNFEKILPSLVKGFSPLFYPLGLVAYWPLIRDPDNDIVGGYNMTPYNTPSIGNHPRIILPQSAL